MSVSDSHYGASPALCISAGAQTVAMRSLLVQDKYAASLNRLASTLSAMCFLTTRCYWKYLWISGHSRIALPLVDKFRLGTCGEGDFWPIRSKRGRVKKPPQKARHLRHEASRNYVDLWLWPMLFSVACLFDCLFVCLRLTLPPLDVGVQPWKPDATLPVWAGIQYNNILATRQADLQHNVAL